VALTQGHPSDGRVKQLAHKARADLVGLVAVA
jgi:hypothetical protein